jgi:hypothetical protein
MDASTVTVVPLMTHRSPVILSTIPTKATGIASTLAFSLVAMGAGVAEVAAAPQALRSSVPMVRTKVRKRIFFMMCLSSLDLIALILAERVFRHNLHWSQLRAAEVEDRLRPKS